MKSKEALEVRRKEISRAGCCNAMDKKAPTHSHATKPKPAYWRDLEPVSALDVPKVEEVWSIRDTDNPRRNLEVICGKPALPGKGKCRKHYLRDVLHVSSRGHGAGKTYRPFFDWQVPLSEMSGLQEDLLADRKRLPLTTSYEESLAALNVIDPSHYLQPIYEKPQKVARRSRRKETK